VDDMSIGEFARASRLSPKALRLYDELGLLTPAHVDASSGYRYYGPGQLEPARLVFTLRQLEVPLVEIKQILDLAPADAADHVARYWAGVEGEHSERRELAASLVDRLNGKRSAMDDVTQHTMPMRHLLCLKRNVEDAAAVWALGKEFIGIVKVRPMPKMGNGPGASFLIYHGDISADSDGPVEWCRPIPADQAEALAAQYPEFTLRTEPAHDEAWVPMGPGGQEIPASQWERLTDGLDQWVTGTGRRPSHLGMRIIYEYNPERAPLSGPDCSFAVPLS